MAGRERNTEKIDVTDEKFVRAGMVMPKEQAYEEVMRFVRLKAISRNDQEDLSDNIEQLASMVEEGLFVFDFETNTIIYKIRLDCPKELPDGIIKIRMRVPTSVINQGFSGVDLQGNQKLAETAYISGIANLPRPTIGRLDPIDTNSIARLIPFFQSV